MSFNYQSVPPCRVFLTVFERIIFVILPGGRCQKILPDAITKVILLVFSMQKGMIGLHSKRPR